MTLKECYEALGGSYESVLGRMLSERLVQKFTLKFTEDKSFQLLKESLESKNYEEAFRAAHTIKGVCQNLGFDRLLESSSSLTEALRNKQYEDVERLFALTEADYDRTLAAIESYRRDNML